MPRDDTVTLEARRDLAAAVAEARSRRRRHDPESSPPTRRFTSRQLHRMGSAAAHAWAGMAVAVVAAAWVVGGVFMGFPSWWINGLEVTTSVVTVVLLFALQHVQARDQTAVQRKLDEILRALPDADTTLVAIEHAPDETLRALTALDQVDHPG